MSDSYRAYCEQQKHNAHAFSNDNVNSIKHAKAFSRMLANAKMSCKTAKLCESKSCANCRNNYYLNNRDICSKLGISISDCDLVCEHWKGKLDKVPSIVPNEDIIAWLTIDEK